MNRKKRSVIVIALLTVLVFAVETTAVSAISLSEVREDIKEKQQELKEQKKKEGSLAEQAEALEKNISAKESNIGKLESAIGDAEKDMDRLEKELKEAEKKVESQDDDLNSRLRNMYKNDSIGFVDVLLGSGSFSEFLINLDMVQKIYSNDKDVLEELKEAYEEIDKKKKEIAALNDDLSASKELVKSERDDLAADKAEVEKKKEAVSADATESQKELEKMEAYSAYLEKLIQQEGSSTNDKDDSDSDSNSGSSSKPSKPNGNNSGSSSKPSKPSKPGGSSGGSSIKPDTSSMAWPAPSYTRVSSRYGKRGSGFHGGVDLAAPGGSPIVAARAGKVIVASYHYSYGNYVIVDHGKGVSTLYAHSSKLLVKKGQKVSKKQKIAKVGTTGNSTGNHLHFEVRINGKRVNPEPYIGL